MRVMTAPFPYGIPLSHKFPRQQVRSGGASAEGRHDLPRRATSSASLTGGRTDHEDVRGEGDLRGPRGEAGQHGRERRPLLQARHVLREIRAEAVGPHHPFVVKAHGEFFR